ncbi:MAG: peptidylprolyl isomerase [Bradymonadia bacterium]
MAASPRLLLALLCAAGTLLSGAASAKVIDRVVAVVNDDIITLSELEEAMVPILRQVDSIPDPLTRAQQREKQMRRGLNDMVGMKLVMQEADKRRINITEGEVSGHIEQVKRQQGWSDEQMQLYLTGQGINTADFRSQVREQLLQRKVIMRVIGDRIRVSEGDLQEFYKSQMTQAQTEFELEAAHILLKLPEGATAVESAAAKQKAEEILARIRAGESFEDLARQYSQGPSAQNGGYLGTFRRGSLDPAFEAIAFNLEVGGVGGPVQTKFGFHVIKALKRNQLPVPPFEEVRSQLRMKLTEKRRVEELKRWVEELKAKSYVQLRL